MLELHQIGDAALARLLRRDRDMRLAVRQAGDPHAIGLGQEDRRAAHAAAGVEHVLARGEAASAHQGTVGAVKAFRVGPGIPPPKPPVNRKMLRVLGQHELGKACD